MRRDPNGALSFLFIRSRMRVVNRSSFELILLYSVGARVNDEHWLLFYSFLIM
jgi:hypothetical protein